MPDGNPYEAPRVAELLQPSLGAKSATAIYSVRASFFVAFFGGPFAIIFFSMINARRLGRLKDDAWVYALAALVTIATLALGVYLVGIGAFPEIGDNDARRWVRYGHRVVALLIFGALYLRHRPFYRAAEMLVDAPSPWLVGIGCVVASGVMQFAAAAALTALLL